MASIKSSSCQKSILTDKRILDNNNNAKNIHFMMLKDYLRDDFSSCSSNGFKSFPRKQCCPATTVRFLLDLDLNLNTTKIKNRKKQFNKTKSTSPSKMSTLRKVVMKAVKLLAFPSYSTSNPSPSKFLPRSFSKKLFKRSFWKKIECKERVIQGNNSGGDDGGEDSSRWRLFHEILEERDNVNIKNNNDSIKECINQQHPTSNSSSDSNSNNSKSNSWSESEFSGNSESYSLQNGVVVSEKDLHKEKKVSDGVGGTFAKEWSNVEEKEQFSPVSVLDCPFQDEEEEVSSPFQRRLDRMEGAKKKLMAKIISFESLAQLEPVNLEKKIKLAESQDDESIESPDQEYSSSVDIKEKKAQELLELVKATTPQSNSIICNADDMLLDFFREKILEKNANTESKELKQELEIVEEWLNGQPEEIFVGWEVKEKRHVYLKDIEKNGKWRNTNEEKEEVILELEIEVFTGLVDEILVDFSSEIS